MTQLAFMSFLVAELLPLPKLLILVHGGTGICRYLPFVVTTWKVPYV